MEHKIILADWMPVSVRGLTAYYFDEDGQVYYTIFLNAKLCAEAQDSAYAHEIHHIINGDFCRMIPVEVIEVFAHGANAIV